MDSVLYLLRHKETFWCLLQESKSVDWKVWRTLFCITSSTKKPFDVYYKKANRLAGRLEGLPRHKETFWCLLEESKSVGWKAWGTLFCIASSTKKPFDVYYKKANRLAGRHAGLSFVSPPQQRNLLMFITRKQIGCLEGMRDSVLYLLRHKEIFWCLLQESKSIGWKAWETLFCISSATKNSFDVYYKKANRSAGRHEGLCFVSPPPQRNLLILLQESKSVGWKAWGTLFCISSATKNPFDVY